MGISYGMDIQTVERIAKLAQLRFSDEEKKRLAAELSSILGYMEELAEVDVTGVEPTGHAVAVTNVFRADEVRREADAERAAELVNAAPDKEDGYVKVKAVL